MKSCKENKKPRTVAKARVVTKMSWDEWHANQNAAPISQSTAVSKPPDLKKAATKPKAAKPSPKTRTNRRPLQLVSWNEWREAEQNRNAWREAENKLSNQLQATTLGKRTKNSKPSQASSLSPSSQLALVREQPEAQNLKAPRGYRDLDDIGPSNPCFDPSICDYTLIQLTEEDMSY